MPIHLDISHLDRIVIAVVIGGATADDIAGLARQFAESGSMHYRKIVDTTAGVLAIDEAGVAAVAAFLRADPKAASRGPLAFVVNPNRPDFFLSEIRRVHGRRAADKDLLQSSRCPPVAR